MEAQIGSKLKSNGRTDDERSRATLSPSFPSSNDRDAHAFHDHHWLWNVFKHAVTPWTCTKVRTARSPRVPLNIGKPLTPLVGPGRALMAGPAWAPLRAAVSGNQLPRPEALNRCQTLGNFTAVPAFVTPRSVNCVPGLTFPHKEPVDEGTAKKYCPLATSKSVESISVNHRDKDRIRIVRRLWQRHARLFRERTRVIRL